MQKKYGFPFCSLGEARGAGAEPLQKLTTTAAVVQTVLPYNEEDGNGEQDFFIMFPVFGGEMARQKSRRSRVREWRFFRALCEKNYSPLDGLDSRNGQ